MNANPDTNLARLIRALEPFADADLVALFRDEGEVEGLRRTLEEISAPDLVTLMIGADRGLTGTFHGTEGFVKAWQDFTATFQQLHSEMRDLVEVGNDVIFAETKQTGITATAGVELDNESAGIFRFAGGRLQQAEFHLDRAAARRAAGIENG